MAPESPAQRRATQRLPQGTGDTIRKLGEFAHAIGWPVDHHLTIRLDGLALVEAEGIAAGLHPADAVQAICMNLRLWLKRHGWPWVAVWARETSPDAGEHLHIALHLGEASEGPLLRHLARLTGEPGDGRRRGKTGVLVGRSVLRNWDLRRDVRHLPGNPILMRYVSKDEPGKRGQGGRIEGTQAQTFRWGFSRKTLGPVAQARHAASEGGANGTGSMPCAHARPGTSHARIA